MEEQIVIEIFQTGEINGQQIPMYKYTPRIKWKQGNIPRAMFEQGYYLFGKKEGALLSRIPTILPSYGWGGNEKKDKKKGKKLEKWNLTCNKTDVQRPYERDYFATNSQVLYEDPNIQGRYLLKVTSEKRKRCTEKADPASELMEAAVDLKLDPSVTPLILNNLDQINPCSIEDYWISENWAEITETLSGWENENMDIWATDLNFETSTRSLSYFHDRISALTMNTEMIKRNQIASIESMLAEGVDVNLPLSNNGSTALHQAAYHCKDGAMIDLLLRHRADPFVLTIGGWFPIHNAVNQRNYSGFYKIMEHIKKMDAEKFESMKQYLELDKVIPKKHFNATILTEYLDKYEKGEKDHIPNL